LKNFKEMVIASALAFGGLLSAHADSILLGSYATTATNPGVANTATTYDPLTSTVDTGSNATFDISAGSVWHAPIGSSSWVSFNAGTGPTSTVVAPNGTYVYNTTFDLGTSAANDVGTLSVLADDTVSVFLNNALILQAAGPMGSTNSYAKCSDIGPNCITPLTFSFTGFTAGVNTLTFDVEQVNLANEGLDFSGSVSSSVPEPLSLILFGTGLISLVGLSRRYTSTE
jgi:hypothetical protein